MIYRTPAMCSNVETAPRARARGRPEYHLPNQGRWAQVVSCGQLYILLRRRSLLLRRDTARGVPSQFMVCTVIRRAQSQRDSNRQIGGPVVTLSMMPPTRAHAGERHMLAA